MKNFAYEEDAIEKHKKRRDGNVSKASRKSEHKHEYAECLLVYPFDFLGRKELSVSLSSYCKFCGKLGYKFKKEDSVVKDYTRINVRANGKKSYSTMPPSELLEKYKSVLPVFNISDAKVEHVCLSAGEEKET